MSGSLRAARRGFATTAVLVSALVLAGCAWLIPSPKTTYTDEHGTEVTVDWRDFPSITGTDVDDVLAGPTVEETEARADEVLDAVRAAITDHIESLGDVNTAGATWNTHRSDNLQGSNWFPGTDNGYGGSSMLQIYNSPVWELEVTVPFSAWDGVLDAGAEALADFGFVDRFDSAIDQGTEEPAAEWVAEAVFGAGAEFMSIVITDTTRDPDVLQDTLESKLALAGITVSYGTSAITESDREEFTRRAAPFVGLEHPNATT